MDIQNWNNDPIDPDEADNEDEVEEISGNSEDDSEDVTIVNNISHSTAIELFSQGLEWAEFNTSINTSINTKF